MNEKEKPNWRTWAGLVGFVSVLAAFVSAGVYHFAMVMEMKEIGGNGVAFAGSSLPVVPDMVWAVRTVIRGFPNRFTSISLLCFVAFSLLATLCILASGYWKDKDAIG